MALVQPPVRTQHPARRGFSLIEVLVALALVAILASLAYPSYVSLVLQSRRLDAVLAMAQLQQAQALWRSRHPGYAGDLTALGLGDTSADRHYRLSITHSGPGGYTATATATGAQARDIGCGSLTLTVTGVDMHYASTGSDAATRCWRQ